MSSVLPNAFANRVRDYDNEYWFLPTDLHSIKLLCQGELRVQVTMAYETYSPPTP